MLSTTRRFDRLVLAAATVVLLSVLVLLFLRTPRFDDLRYQEHVAALREVDQRDDQTDVDLLRLRNGLADDYGTVIDGVGQVSTLLASTCAAITDEAHDEAVELRRRCDALRDLHARKAALVERLEEHDVLLRDAVAALPTAAIAANAALARPRARVQESDAEAVHDILIATLVFVRRATPDQAAQLQRALDDLDRLAARGSREVVDRVAAFSGPVRTIVHEQPVVDELLTSISAMPVSEAIDEIGRRLLAEQQRAGVQSARDRLCLVVLSAVLVALLLYVGVRLARSVATIRQSNAKLLKYGHGLEALVAERVAELHDSEARMAQLARFDTLTGLPNRHLFQDRLREAMIRADRDQRVMALMFVDLDHFKQINDSVGHAVGDGVLRAVAQRLRETIRDVDTVARLGGDEFTIICEGLPHAAAVTRLAEKVREALNAPLVVDGRSFVVSASIGIALHTMGSGDRDNLLRSADIAMYRAKEGGRNAYALFAPEMGVAVTQRATMEGLLRTALERDEFALVYQPKVELATGRICGVETLLRWNSRELGNVAPTDFIPLAEEMGLVTSIGAWVLGSACAQAMAWRAEGLPPLGLAVNLSPRELKDAHLLERVAAVLARTGLPAADLEFELTEGVVMDDVKRNVETLDAIRALGVRLAIDDVGTGYSSLAYLSRLPIQTLKIDRALITPMETNASAATLVSTMVTLAHSLDVEVVAEGVETQIQRNLLVAMGCDQLQGFLFSKPLTADALASLVRTHVLSTALSAMPLDPALMD